MSRKFPSLYNLLKFLLAQGQIYLVQPDFWLPGATGQPLVLNSWLRVNIVTAENLVRPQTAAPVGMIHYFPQNILLLAQEGSCQVYMVGILLPQTKIHLDTDVKEFIDLWPLCQQYLNRGKLASPDTVIDMLCNSMWYIPRFIFQ